MRVPFPLVSCCGLLLALAFACEAVQDRTQGARTVVSLLRFFCTATCCHIHHAFFSHHGLCDKLQSCSFLAFLFFIYLSPGPRRTRSSARMHIFPFLLRAWRSALLVRSVRAGPPAWPMNASKGDPFDLAVAFVVRWFCLPSCPSVTLASLFFPLPRCSMGSAACSSGSFLSACDADATFTSLSQVLMTLALLPRRESIACSGRMIAVSRHARCLSRSSPLLQQALRSTNHFVSALKNEDVGAKIE